MQGTPVARHADHEAVKDLWHQYRLVLVRYFARHGVGVEDREDTTQEVFTRLAARGDFSRIERRDAYLFETAANVAVDYHRRACVRRRGTHEEYEETLHGTSELSTERRHAAQEELHLFVCALREMPERIRNVFILARLESVPQAQIARQLGISASAVEKNLVRAIAYLKSRLERAP